VAASSAAVVSGAIFVAVPGNAVDGHAFVDDAFARGAVAAVVQDPTVLQGRPGIVVAHSRSALSRLAALFAGDPSHRMKVIGITGTNGKTTTNWIIYHMLNALGERALRIGTLGWEWSGGAAVEGALTSPDPISLHRVLQEARQAGVTAAVMETSSHALDQARVEDVEFDVGVFTNLTRDHLDYHGTFERYFAAKSHLFHLLGHGTKRTKAAVINADDPYGERMLTEARQRGLVDWSFGSDTSAAVAIRAVNEVESGMAIDLLVRAPRDGASPGEGELKKELRMLAPFTGRHNAENVVAAFTALCALGYEPERVVKAAQLVPQVPGRLERVGEGSVRVFVDYAHTPDALERAIAALRPSTAGRLWVVFGCGGDRDRGKRPEMARVAATGADRVVVTSDNPRTEEPLAIIADVLSSGVTPHYVEQDRRHAITTAVHSAEAGDTVLIAGKGHETYQILGSERVYFSDQEEAARALSSRI
jgi:UDP-N-acetylmuramoyl-L-alanyl-D-glutamate--2,6-diaminopimelate ligase